MALLLEGLLLNQTFLFVGYGLKDPNFRQIYSRIADMRKDAKREAFALTVDAPSDTGPYLSRQWLSKGLHLLAMPGEADEERVQVSLRFLDWLADRVRLSAPGLFLAPDVPTTGPLQSLREELIEGVGRALEETYERDWSRCQTHHLVRVLEFLTKNGWRPRLGPDHLLCNMWEKLADDAGDAAERRRLLIIALGHTERFDDAQHIRKRLAEIEGTG
jgi:hypothetical protein